MKKKVLIINGHPDEESYNKGIEKAYARGLDPKKTEHRILALSNLKFDTNLHYGYRKRTTLEPDLEQAIDWIKWADHLVWIHPVWWYSMPALLKGFIDRTFLPGIAFETIEGKSFPKQLFKGKTGHIIATSDTPWWYYRYIMKAPATFELKKGTLEFTGISPVKNTYIAPIKGSTPEFRKKWLDKIEVMARQV